jgi:hypothetical protein
MKVQGKILIDFANADSTDAACLTYLENIQALISFQPGFARRIQKTFPSLQSFLKPLNQTERTHLEFIANESKILADLNARFLNIDYELTGYDYYHRTLSLMSMKWERRTSDNETSDTASGREADGSSGFLNTLKMLGISAVDGPIAVKIDAIADEIRDHMGKKTMDQITKLMNIGRNIDELTSGFSEERLNLLQDLTRQFQAINNFHKQIENLQVRLRDILEMIAAGKALRDIPALLEFLQVYNSMQPNEVVISDDDALVSLAPISEENYLLIKDVNGWHESFFNEITFWTIEFFRNEKNRHYIQKCPACSNFFIPYRPGKQKFCRKRCRLKGQKGQSA